VLLDATVALDQALDAGRGVTRTIDAAASGTRSPATTEYRLRSALDDGEFWLLYLPVVTLTDQRLVGVEALLRWADPERGLVHPDRFFYALNETGLIVPVGDWVLREAARQCRAWHDQHPDRPPLDITINVSPRQLMQADFVDRVEAALEESGADPGHLCLEVAEGALVHQPDQLWTTLRDAKQRGLRLGIDDFGTGHTSLQHLRQFNLDQLKIDRSFVAELPVSEADRSIVGHVIGLAHELGVVPVAEGIETVDQLEVLRQLGCDLGQGFHFSTPQPPEVIASLIVEGLAALAEPPAVVVDVRTTEATNVPGPLA
jgi:EAL domain-containing protein (putative c-di-GMP-specific phosphodiesterase class I)